MLLAQLAKAPEGKMPLSEANRKLPVSLKKSLHLGKGGRRSPTGADRFRLCKQDRVGKKADVPDYGRRGATIAIPAALPASAQAAGSAEPAAGPQRHQAARQNPRAS